MSAPKRRFRFFGLLRWIIILFGVVILAYPSLSAYLTEKNASRTTAAYDGYIKKAAEEERKALLQAARDYNIRLLAVNGHDAPRTDEVGTPLTLDNYWQVLDIDRHGMMGYLVIPKLGETIAIKHGTHEAVLQEAVGHVVNTSLPVGGTSTHAALSGHRGLPTASLFTDLDQLAIGDEFYIRVLDQSLAYRVDQILTVLPEETEHLAIEEGQDYVTLITCTPYGVNSHRLLVRGTRVPYTRTEDIQQIVAEAQEEVDLFQRIPIENSQRDINIAFMNELSIIFNKMGIDTKFVLEAAGTKWNFLKFYPGLVGGHCIGVDPYYLTYKAEQMGYHSQIILAGRRINDDMGKYVAENVVKNLIAADKAVKHARVAILGFTFKENCPDTRNTRIIDIVNELREYGIEPVIADPQADADEAKRLYDVEFVQMAEIAGMDAMVLAVAHAEFKTLTMAQMDALYRDGRKVLLDLKGLLDRGAYENAGYCYWRL